MKTKGQRLYEHKNPPYLEVVLLTDVFREHPFHVSNPASPTPWHLLSERCRQGWEVTAEGHNLFSEEPT